MKAIINHIPRTIFGVKYTYKDGEDIQLNCIDYCYSKNNQDNRIKYLSNYPLFYNSITPIKWLIKPE